MISASPGWTASASGRAPTPDDVQAAVAEGGEDGDACARRCRRRRCARRRATTRASPGPRPVRGLVMSCGAARSTTAARSRGPPEPTNARRPRIASPPPPRPLPSLIARPSEPPTGSSGTRRRLPRARSTRGRRRRTRSPRRPAMRALRRTRCVARSTTTARPPASVSTARVPSGVMRERARDARQPDGGERAAAWRRRGSRARGRGWRTRARRRARWRRPSRRRRAPRCPRRPRVPRSIAVTPRPAATYAREPSAAVATARARPGSATRAAIALVDTSSSAACGRSVATTTTRACAAAGASRREHERRAAREPAHRGPQPGPATGGRSCAHECHLDPRMAGRDDTRRVACRSCPLDDGVAPRAAARHEAAARGCRAAEPLRRGRRSRAPPSCAPRWTASSSTPPATRSRRRKPTSLVWDGASLAGPRDVLDGAWLALRPLAKVLDRRRSCPGGKLLLIAPPPCDAGAEAARAGLENLARTLSIEWARYGIRTVAILPGEATEPDEVAELVAFLASLGGRLLLRLPLPDGRGVSERWRVTSPRRRRAAARPRHAALAAGPPRARHRRVRHQRLRRPQGRRRRRRAPHRGGHRPRGAVLRRARLGHVHARGRELPRPRRHLRLPARPDRPPPRHRRRARHRRALLRRLERPRVPVSGWESRFRATAIRERGSAAGARALRGGAGRRPRRASGRTTTSPAGTRSTATRPRRAACSTARSSSGGDAVRDQAANDPDLESPPLARARPRARRSPSSTRSSPNTNSSSGSSSWRERLGAERGVEGGEVLGRRSAARASRPSSA